MTTVQHKSLNGIDTDALHQTIQDVAAHPEHGKAGFFVTTRWKGGTKTESHVPFWTIGGKRVDRNFTVRTDEPPELCGQATDANPQEVLFAGLNACMMVGYAAGCAMHGIELESLEIETNGELDLRGFLGIEPDVKPGYHEVEYTVRIKGSGTPEQFQQIHETVMATSPNFSNFSTPIRLKPHLVVE